MLGTIGSQIVLLAWVPVVLSIFVVLPARRAMVATAVAGWLLLPPGIQIGIPGLPDFGKTTSVVMGLLFATIIFEPGRLINFRPRWFDLPIIVLCVCPFFSSISNNLGAYDGLSSVFTYFMNWLMPYWIGRLYLTDAASFRELGLGMIIGGVCLTPFCLIESKMSQIMQPMLYGIEKWEEMRFEGFRPRVFFSTGLELGLWMNAVTLVAWWFWRTGQFKQLWGIPSGAIFALLLTVAIWCRATGATLLLICAFLALVISLRTRTKWALWGLLCIAPIFCTVRSANLWSGQSAVELARLLVGAARADSLDYRLENDDMLIAKALQQPIFGWGGWSRNRVFDETGRDLAVTDGFWIIEFGTHGYVGLISMTLAMLLPVGLFLARFPTDRWNQPGIASVTVIATILNLFLIDCLVNAMPNVIYVIAAGGLFNIVSTRTKPKSSDRGADTPALTAMSREMLASRYRAQGRLSKDQGQFIDAKTSWLYAIDLLSKQLTGRPDRPDLHQQWCDCANDLAWLLANAADPAVRDPALAVSLAVKTTERYPDCKTYWNTLGASHYRAGELEAADAALERSMTLGNGGTAFDYIFLTMTHARLGNQEQARRWFAEAVDSMERLHPDHPELRDLCAEAKSLLSAVHETPASVR